MQPNTLVLQFADAEAYLNAQKVLEGLVGLGVLPGVNLLWGGLRELTITLWKDND